MEKIFKEAIVVLNVLEKANKARTEKSSLGLAIWRSVFAFPKAFSVECIRRLSLIGVSSGETSR